MYFNRLPCFSSSWWIIMAHLLISPLIQHCCCLLARLAMPSPSLCSLLEAGISKDGVHLHPLCLSARAAYGGVSFTDSRGVSSGLCYRVITDANASWETCCLRERGAARRGLPLPGRGSLFPGGCAFPVPWHGITSVWRTSRINNSTSKNGGMWGIRYFSESGGP